MRWLIWILLLGFLIFSENRLRTAGEEYVKPAFGGMNPPDLSIGISKESLIQFYKTGGKEGREIYANTIIRYDFLYPLSYGMFFSYTIILLTSGFKNRLFSNAALLPIVAMLSDMVENVGFILLAYEYPDFNDTLFTTARTAQLAKWYLAFASVAVIVALLIANGIRLVKKPKSS